MADITAKNKRRTRRHMSIRRRVSGTQERPRLVVFRSLKNIYAQVINDLDGRTIASAGSDSKEIASQSLAPKTEEAKAVGKLIAERAMAAGVTHVAFDRAGYKFHGRVKALAEAAREEGLDF
jgi:large subunit ribosomal protein L18